VQTVLNFFAILFESVGEVIRVNDHAKRDQEEDEKKCR